MAKTNTSTKTFQFKLRPNKAFVEACEKTLDQARFLWNVSLEQRISHYRQTLALTCKGESLNFYEQSRQLTEARDELPELKSCLRSIQSDVLKRLDLAFDAFFRRLKEGSGKAGFPRFKGKDRYNSFSQSIETQRGCPLNGDKLTVPGVGSCRVRLSRPIEGKVKQLRITRRASGWYVCLVCEMPRSEALPATGLSVGIDAGITDFATLSNGETIANPRHLKKAAGKLKLAQQRLAKKKKGSENRRKARRVVALKHERVGNCRKDFHHKVSHDLVKRFDTIKVEALNIRGLVKNHHLAKAINDVAWGNFFNITKAKAENAGRTFEKVNPAYTSQECSGCGARQKMPLSVRVYECGKCHLKIHRDVNAAINILGRGAPSKPVELRQRDCEAGISNYLSNSVRRLKGRTIPDLCA
jgi:putative transposase